MSRICILRIGHRPERDQRVTTHVGLCARALGASGMYLSGTDSSIKRSVEDVVERWGGHFFLEDGVSWRSCIKQWKEDGGMVVHLTMYGERMTETIDEIREGHKDLLVIVGAEKVPGEIYGLADYNVSVTTQPHSEISSLAIFLDRYTEGSGLNRDYPDARIRIEPSKLGKRTIEK